MNEVQLFNFENHEVRSLLINSEPWFVGKDVADVLICIAELVCLGYLDIDKVRDYQKLKINREIERAIQKEEELRKETEKHGTCE